MSETCALIRQSALEIARGERRFDEHLSSCPECRGYLDEVNRLRKAIGSIPEIEPSEHVLPGVRGRIGERGLKPIRPWIVAAACVAIGIFATLVLIQRTSEERVVGVVAWAAPGSSFSASQQIKSGPSYEFTHSVTMTLPDVGTLWIREGSRVRFKDRQKVILDQGEVFAAITAATFTVATAGFEATVLGTKFGVRPDEVYVIEGAVRVASPTGETQVYAGSKCKAGGAAVSMNSFDEMAWLAGIEPVSLSLSVDRWESGEKVKVRLANGSRLLPLYLAAETTGAYLQAKVTDSNGKTFSARLDPSSILGATYEERLIRLGPLGAVEMEAPVPREIFSSPGEYRVKFLYTSGGHPDRRVWIGSVECSNSFNVRVK